MRIVVVGGGPAGIIAAIAGAKEANVILLEKMESLGKKLLITGKGRCNITSSIEMEDFIGNVPGNGKFLYSAFQRFTNRDIIELLKQEGVEVKEERGNRIFPKSDSARDVLNALILKAKNVGVEIKTNQEVIEILQKDGFAYGVKTKNGKIYECDKVILATGGKSYPITGSTGSGYEMAKKLGHTITKIKPSLVPLTCMEQEMCKNMQGLSLKNVEIQILDKNKIIYSDFGEMLFTHYGVSGPTILSGSAHLVRYKNVEELLSKREIKLRIDLKPALTEEKLDYRILRDFSEQKNKMYKNSLYKLFPQKMIPQIIKLSKISPEKPVNEITKKERMELINIIKKFELTINGFRPIEEAIITSGGINIKEVDPKTMESKIIKGLYFAGEILDVDAYTGGFNLQIAYSTGYSAGSK